jgi:hypothetical protein
MSFPLSESSRFEISDILNIALSEQSRRLPETLERLPEIHEGLPNLAESNGQEKS